MVNCWDYAVQSALCKSLWAPFLTVFVQLMYCLVMCCVVDLNPTFLVHLYLTGQVSLRTNKELIKSRGRQFKGTKFGLNDQFLSEINKRRKRLYPVQRQQRMDGRRGFINVDKLFIDGQLFPDSSITPWQY